MTTGAMDHWPLYLMLLLTVRLSATVQFDDGHLINEQPRLLIGYGKAITRNTRQITDIHAVTTSTTIQVLWNMTPSSTEGFPCCPFTLLEVYPLDVTGAKTAGESVVLLKPNVTDYMVNVTQLPLESFLVEYLICVRLWHRIGGAERKLDERCVKVQLPPRRTQAGVIVIVFSVVIAVNFLLIAVLLLLKVFRRQTTSPSFTVKKWWKDVSDVLHQHQNAGSSQSYIFSEVGSVDAELGRYNNGMPGMLHGTMNNAMYYQQELAGPMEVGAPQQVPTVCGSMGNGCCCMNEHEYDLSLIRLHQLQQLQHKSNNQIHIVRNGPFSAITIV